MPNFRVYFRVCSEHRADLKEAGPNTVAGREKLFCPAGHECRSWLVIDEDGNVIGTGKINEYSPREKKHVR